LDEEDAVEHLGSLEYSDSDSDPELTQGTEVRHFLSSLTLPTRKKKKQTCCFPFYSMHHTMQEEPISEREQSNPMQPILMQPISIEDQFENLSDERYNTIVMTTLAQVHQFLSLAQY
jgi:hypothetical protein